MDDEPKSADEFLQHESQSAREALKQLRGEMLDSLKRTADAAAWTKRYPWQSLGTAAIAGLGTGWALGKTFRRNRSTESAASEDQPEQAAAAESPSAASRLVGGLGTLTGALASAAFAAAAESLKDLVTDSIHSALHPDMDANAPPDEDAASPEDPSSRDS